MEWKFPDVGEGLHEAQIVKWYKAEGDAISRDEPLVDVETDKAVVTIPCPVDGTINKIRYREGDMVRVGEVVVSFNTQDRTETVARDAIEVQTPKTAINDSHKRPDRDVHDATENNRPITRESGSKVLATPAVRRRAREMGIDLANVVGTGPAGRVLERDLQEVHFTGAESDTVNETKPIAGDERVALLGVRKRIAENMARSWSHAVQVSVFEEFDASRLVSFRAELNRAMAPDRVTYLPFVIKATAVMLKRMKMLNATLDEETNEIVYHRRYDIGIAVDDPGGLVVPVLRAADRLPLKELVKELSRLIRAAHEHKLNSAEMTGSTFTITNFGSIGGVFATPIINYPETAILGVGPIRKKPVVNAQGEVVPGDVMSLVVTFDHRVIDGGDASRFLVGMVELLSDPYRLLMEF
jgi:pyruvate dehydrogenase E2 component (dihydrolipoamide acetyltransferase)